MEIVGRIYTISNGTFFKDRSVKKVTWGVGFFHDYFLLIRGKVLGLGDWGKQVALEKSVSGECNSGLLG